MTNILLAIFLCALAYLIGSIPTSIWVSKFVFKIDIRDYGSGNAGATNSFRFLGKKWAIFILIIDIAKGIGASLLVNKHHYFVNDQDPMYLNFQLLLGFMAIIGHIFPIFANFKGGKGIATMFGVILAVSPTFGLVAAVTFFVIFLTTHYVALGSMLGAVSFTIAIIFFAKNGFHFISATLAFLCTALVVIKHRTNIARLLKGEETKMYLKKKNDEKIEKKTNENK